MNNITQMISKLSEASVKGVSRREFMKLLWNTSEATVLVMLGLDKIPLSYCSQACTSPPPSSVPCCIQKGYHIQEADCSGTQIVCVNGAPCEVDKMCKHGCSRICYYGSCGSWVLTNSCVWCDSGLRSKCLGWTPIGPPCPALPENEKEV